jgi:DNA-binding FadR family transcriptional regulator
MATLHTDVLGSLGPSIVEGALPGDSMITLDWLCKEYAVSRTIAREVVQVLASMGLVESRRRTGIRVLPEEHWDVFDPAVLRWWLASSRRPELLQQLSQLRVSVEPLAAALAARHATDEQRLHVVTLAERMEETGARGDLRAFLEHDVTFHRLLLDASGNVLFARLGDVVEEVLRGRTDHHLMPPEPKPEARRLHSMVADAVERGEPELAQAAMSAICAEVLAEMAPEAGNGQA